MAYWLFSQMKTTGSFQSPASARPSWKAPMLAVPSPKKQRVTSGSPRYLLPNATPAAIGTCPPTIAHPPKKRPAAPGKAPQASVRSEDRTQRERWIRLAACGGPHRGEGAAMDGRRPERADGGEVRPRRVAHVTREAVAWVAPVERAHERVAVHLGDDRGGGDRAHERVALGVGALRHREIGDLTPVDEHEAGHERQRLDRPPAGGEPGAIDVEAVDLVGLDHPEADGDGAAADLDVQPLAQGGGQDLRVRDAVEARAGREDDRSRDHGTGERSHADLVHTGDVPDADPPEERLQVRRGGRRPAPALSRTAPPDSHPRVLR